MRLTATSKRLIRSAMRGCQLARRRRWPGSQSAGDRPTPPPGTVRLCTPAAETFDAAEAKGASLEIVNNCDEDDLFQCQINDFAMLVPAKILRLYPHCLHPAAGQHLTYYVETAQSRWLCSKLRRGDTAFDIGAATGLLTLAMSRTVSDSGKLYSFEPSRGTFRTLEGLVHHNGLRNVEAVPAAIGEGAGEAEFIEYQATPDTDWSWAPDASTIATGADPRHPHERYSVQLTTIDLFATSREVSPRAIKIDIEGLEVDALEGGEETLRRGRLFLCIDIHNDPRTGASTRAAVEKHLAARGYRHFMEGHALYAEHVDRGDQ